MKLSLSVLLLSVALSLSARGDLTIVQNVEGAGPVGVMTIKIKGDKARIEPSPQITTIIDSKSGEMLNLMNDQKKFLRISADKAKAVAEMAIKADPNKQPAEKPFLRPTGRKETILGYEAEEYVCEAPSFKATYWISTTFPDAKAIVKQLQALTPQSWDAMGKGMPDYRDFPGLPLRSSVNMGGNQITSTLTSVKQDPLSEAAFTPPKDFEEMKMPNLDTMFGGKPDAPPPPAPPKP